MLDSPDVVSLRLPGCRLFRGEQQEDQDDERRCIASCWLGAPMAEVAGGV